MQILAPDLKIKMSIEDYDVKKNIIKPRVNILNHFLKTSLRLLTWLLMAYSLRRPRGDVSRGDARSSLDKPEPETRTSKTRTAINTFVVCTYRHQMCDEKNIK